MKTINYGGSQYQCREDETLLDALLRQGAKIPFSCRNGVCHACLHHAEQGEIPPEAQRGLDEKKRAEGMFLPCKCHPKDDMTIISAKEAAQKKVKAQDERERQAPDPEIWAALNNGELLFPILDDFYTQVYEDERLAPFFHGVTRRRAAEKQSLFLRQLFTGEKVYFGDRPRNAHHWMVISDELFDYREELMANTLRRHGMAEHLIERWIAMEEHFRPDIVKDEPWKRKIGDIELPLEGYEETVLEVGSICDSCESEVDAGTKVRYHLRLGSIYCPRCM